ITICGRAGSKGVPNKNLASLMGYPLILFSLSAAHLFKLKAQEEYNVDIVVDSDSAELLEIAKSTGLCFLSTRPSEYSTDQAPKMSVLIYALTTREQEAGKTYDYLIDLDITSPIRSVEDILNVLDKCVENPFLDVVFTVVSARRNPYFNMVEEVDGILKRVKKSDAVSRQQVPPVYEMNASIYCYRRKSLGVSLLRSPLDGKAGGVLMKDYLVLDIDSLEDLEYLTLLAPEIAKKERGFFEIVDHIKNIRKG
ncbi:MAG TPA: acylneuraminate cytidylyltransferase family protein, partial [Thermotogota bacterium]|nr:acylneuraminate cytidylyltransferase family protein [Thermotogota bacterium]